jgi:RNA polymerase sigma-70 factor (ECF subfamily)
MGLEVSRTMRSETDDRHRFEEIYANTRQALLGYLVRRSESIDDAADLLAEVYLVAWRRIEDVPAGDESRLWLFGVARRVLANHHRRGRNESQLAGALETALRLHAESIPAAALGDLEGRVAGALSALSAPDRELLMLNAWDELTPAEIAVVLRRPVGVVRVRLHRARKRLRARLADSEADGAPLNKIVPSVIVGMDGIVDSQHRRPRGRLSA